MQGKSFGSVRIFSPRLSRDEVIEHLQSRMPHLLEHLPARRVVLFGSYAAGRHTAASDIDVLVVYAGNPRPNAYAIVRSALDLRGLEPHIYTEDEAAQLGEILDRMARGGVTIWEGVGR